MTLDYNPFWFGVLIGLGVAFISLAILFGLKIAYSEEGIIIEDNKPQLKCIILNDGKAAVIQILGCTGSYETIAFFLHNGYHLEPTSDFQNCYTKAVFMTR